MKNKAKFVALLRGVNVGGHKVSMAELKNLVEKEGFAEVSTLLQSGNVILEAEISAVKIKQKLEAAIGKKFGYLAIIFVYPVNDIAKTVDSYPFDTNETQHQHYVVFLTSASPSELMALPRDKDLEALSEGKGVLYWKVKKGYSVDSAFSKQLSKAKYKSQNTVRNINTLRKIIAKAYP